MPGKNIQLNALQSRKQLLVAESELHRAQLEQDWDSARLELRALASQARSMSWLVAVGTALITGIAAARRQQSAAAPKKASLVTKLLKGAALVSTCWNALRRPPRG